MQDRGVARIHVTLCSCPGLISYIWRVRENEIPKWFAPFCFRLLSLFNYVFCATEKWLTRDAVDKHVSQSLYQRTNALQKVQ